MLNVETGAASPDAESYASVADANAYLLARGFEAWGRLSIENREMALRRATDFMSQLYGERWGGYRRTFDQALDWPRAEVQRRDAPTVYGSVSGYGGNYYPSDAVPVGVVNACALLAAKSTEGDLMPDLDPAVAAESIGGVSVSYAPGASRLPRYPAVDNMLSPYLRSGGGMVRLMRA